MRKTHKKIDNQIRIALTDVCTAALQHYDGFCWLTHTVDFGQFPKSLKIVCIFDTDDNLANFVALKNSLQLNAMIVAKLSGIGIQLQRLSSHIYYDTEQACKIQNNGNWAKRLA